MEQELVSLELPPLGKLNIILRGTSKVLYNKLEKDGLIRNLKSIKHLGVISLSHPSSKHTRWEYVCLMLYLLQKIWNSTLVTGLNSNIKSMNISGEEFLQCCILLSNIGHLPGTISSEKGLMKFLSENEKERISFLSNLSVHSEYEDLIKSCLTNYDFYKLKYLITLNYLYYKDYKDFIEIFKTFVIYSIINDTPHVRKLKRLYFRIRQLSFIFLDSFHSCFPIGLEIQKILFNIEEYEEIFNPNSHTFDNVLEHYENSLTKNLYISPESSSIHSRNIRFCNIFLQKEKNNIEFDNFLISYSRRKKRKKEFSIDQDYMEFVFQPYLSLYDIVDFKKILKYDFNSNLVDLLGQEKDLSKILNRGLSVKTNDFCILNDNRRNIIFLNFLIQKFSLKTLSDYSRLILNLNLCLLKVFTIFHYSTTTEVLNNYINHLLFKSIIRKYLQFLLEFLVKDSFFINNQDELISYVKFDYQHIIEGKKFPTTETSFLSGKKTMIKMYERMIKEFEEIPDIQNNMKIVKTILSKHTSFSNRFYLFGCNLPIEIEEKKFQPELLRKTSVPEQRKSITDIDCVILLFNKSKYELYIIEGKDTRRGVEGKVRKDFKKITDLLQFHNTFNEPTIVNNKVEGKGGFIKLSFP